MANQKFKFMKNKSFIGGFITGVLLATVITLVVISLYQPAPGEKALKGTLLNWTPSVGDIGYIKWTGDSDSCGRFIGVSFYNDPMGSLIICRPEGAIISGSEVKVIRIAEGKPCGDPPGGIWVGPANSEKIKIPK